MNWLVEIYRNGEKAAELPVAPGELKDVVMQYQKMFPQDRCVCNPIIEFSGEYDERESRTSSDVAGAAVSSDDGPGHDTDAATSAG